jgi:hypothetical protein
MPTVGDLMQIRPAYCPNGRRPANLDVPRMGRGDTGREVRVQLGKPFLASAGVGLKPLVGRLQFGVKVTVWKRCGAARFVSTSALLQLCRPSIRAAVTRLRCSYAVRLGQLFTEMSERG